MVTTVSSRLHPLVLASGTLHDTGIRCVIVPEASVTNRVGFGQLIGKGFFSVVHSGTTRAGRMCAVKIARKAMFQQFKDKRRTRLVVTDEADILAKIEHERILTFLDAFQTQTNVYLATDLLKGGDLMTVLLDDTRFQESDQKRMFTDTCMVKGLRTAT